MDTSMLGLVVLAVVAGIVALFAQFPATCGGSSSSVSPGPPHDEQEESLNRDSAVICTAIAAKSDPPIEGSPRPTAAVAASARTTVWQFSSDDISDLSDLEVQWPTNEDGDEVNVEPPGDPPTPVSAYVLSSVNLELLQEIITKRRKDEALTEAPYKHASEREQEITDQAVRECVM